MLLATVSSLGSRGSARTRSVPWTFHGAEELRSRIVSLSVRGGTGTNGTRWNFNLHTKYNTFALCHTVILIKMLFRWFSFMAYRTQWWTSRKENWISTRTCLTWWRTWTETKMEMFSFFVRQVHKLLLYIFFNTFLI